MIRKMSIWNEFRKALGDKVAYCECTLVYLMEFELTFENKLVMKALRLNINSLRRRRMLVEIFSR